MRQRNPDPCTKSHAMHAPCRTESAVPPSLWPPSAPAPVTRYTTFDALPQFLTVEEFRTFVGLGRSTVYDLLRRGAIPHRRFGRVVRIPKSALRPYLDLPEDGMESSDGQM